jgi:hypothetical protein
MTKFTACGLHHLTAPVARPAVASAARWSVAATWLVHGAYNKLLGGSPRHLQIVQAIPGCGRQHCCR